MVDLRLRDEFDLALASVYAKVPRRWLDALRAIDPREADRFLMALSKGPGIRPALASTTAFLKARIRKKRGRGLPGRSAFGAGPSTANPPSPNRFRLHAVRDYGPGFAMLPFDATLAFLSPASGARALHIARTNPRATICIVQTGASPVIEELRQQKNVRLFGSEAEIVSALREAGTPIGMLDLGQNARIEVFETLQDIDTELLVGAFDPLVVDDTAAFLAAARAQASRGYFLHRHDAQRYSYARSARGPAISVVVPVYNVLAYLDECVAALSAQTFKDREIVLVDDGATDGSAQRCDELASKDATIRVIHKPNGGCASARMAGLEAARGEYVTFVDGDDWVDPTMLQRLFDLVLETGENVVEGGWCYAFPSGAVDDQTLRERSECYVGQGGLPRRIRDAALVAQPTIWRRLYRREFLQIHKIGFDVRLRRFDDMPFQFQTLINTGDIPYSTHCLTYYRQNREGQDIGVTDERLYVHFPILNLLRETALSSGDKSVWKNFLIVQYHTHEWALTKIKPELMATYRDLMARDLFGPEQYGGSLANLMRFRRLFPRQRKKILKLFVRYRRSAHQLTLPSIDDVR